MSQIDIEPSRAVDRLIGGRIRQRRRALNLSLKTLAQQVGVSLQQLQKYELGSNRIAIARLPVIAHHLDISMSELLADTDVEGQAAAPSSSGGAETVELAARFESLSPDAKRLVLELVKMLEAASRPPAS